MSDSSCPHPRGAISLVEQDNNSYTGESVVGVPQYWTVIGQCTNCGEMVEVDFKFDNVTE